MILPDFPFLPLSTDNALRKSVTYKGRLRRVGIFPLCGDFGGIDTPNIAQYPKRHWAAGESVSERDLRFARSFHIGLIFITDKSITYEFRISRVGIFPHQALPIRLSGFSVVFALPHALDVGAGSGSDAAWLSDNGLSVVAVQPCARLREAARVRYLHKQVAWVDDALSDFARVLTDGPRFDLVLVNAVLMHVSAAEQARAIETLYAALAPHRLLVLTVRRGGNDAADRGFCTVRVEGLQCRARRRGASIVRCDTDADHRPGIAWDRLVIRRPGH